MEWRFARTAGPAAVAVAMVLAGASPALAAKHTHHKRTAAKRHATATSSTSTSTSGNGETALTDPALTSAENAATAANPGATANSATTETDSSLTGATYEVHITQADGSRAVVIEDSAFKVLATQAAGGGGGGCDGGPGTGNGETALTGTQLTSAEAAATKANPGATAEDATTETDSSLTGAAYEVHITQPDGSHAKVIEDSSYDVLATQVERGGPRGH